MALKQQLNMKQAPAVGHLGTWLAEKSSWEDERPLWDSDTLETGTRISFPFFLFTTMLPQRVDGAGNEGPFSSKRSFCFHDHTASIQMIWKYRNRVSDDEISLALNCSLKKHLCANQVSPSLPQRCEFNQKKGRPCNFSTFLMQWLSDVKMEQHQSNDQKSSSCRLMS